MSWQDSLSENITLTSPSGLEFIAGWRGDSISMSNKVGVHEIPGVSGSRVQSQGATAKTYELTITFSGINHDLDATAFFKTLENEVEAWSIVHPVKGRLSLIWLDATEQVQPVESAGLTVISTNWIDSLADSVRESAAQIQQEVEAQAEATELASSDQFQKSLCRIVQRW